MVRKNIQEGELNAASRVLKEDNKGVEIPTDLTFQKMAAMFPRRKDKDQPLPALNPTATKLSHFKPNDIIKSIEALQASGGLSILSIPQDGASIYLFIYLINYHANSYGRTFSPLQML